jgi:DMSO/TMAO reductase YedYZ molybdopterin-dependent catalytic subunit
MNTPMTEITRRDALTRLAAAGVFTFGIPDWVLPALAQDDTLVPFTDMPAEFSTSMGERIRVLDIRTIDGMFTPADQFFAIQHYNVPEVDGGSFRLKIDGLVNATRELSLDDIKARPRVEVPAGYECSGNSPRITQGLVSNGRWVGTSLKDLLNDVGLQADGREVVFFGADRQTEKIESRGRSWELEQAFGRALSRDDALAGDALLAYELNGEPLSVRQGFPLRLVVPGWYGVANVKWLNRIHVQQGRFMGKFMAREYVTLRGQQIGGEVYYNETSVTRLQLKSVIARVSRSGAGHSVLGFVLNDGTPLRSVEVKIDDGAWQTATLNPDNTQYSWKLFTFDWQGATPGEHTLVSRATDGNGRVQRALPDELKKTSWENDEQFPRKVMIG